LAVLTEAAMVGFEVVGILGDGHLVGVEYGKSCVVRTRESWWRPYLTSANWTGQTS
jgi:hypothetical protein